MILHCHCSVSFSSYPFSFSFSCLLLVHPWLSFSPSPFLPGNLPYSQFALSWTDPSSLSPPALGFHYELSSSLGLLVFSFLLPALCPLGPGPHPNQILHQEHVGDLAPELFDPTAPFQAAFPNPLSILSQSWSQESSTSTYLCGPALSGPLEFFSSYISLPHSHKCDTRNSALLAPSRNGSSTHHY